MEALKKKAGRPSKDNLSPLATNSSIDTASEIGSVNNDSRDQVFRYIRLTELIPPLLQMVDEGRIAFRPAVELSYLDKTEQEDLLETIDSEDCTPSLAQAIRMKALSRDNQLDMDTIFNIMTEEKANQKEKIRIPMERVETYFKRGTPPNVIVDTIVKALEYYRQAISRQKAKVAGQDISDKTAVEAAPKVKRGEAR